MNAPVNVPSCMHGLPFSDYCEQCRPFQYTCPQAERGWLCPGCGRGWAPWVQECHFCPDENGRLKNTPKGSVFPYGPLAPVKPVPVDEDGGQSSPRTHLALPPEMALPHYCFVHRASSGWREVWPGLQCRASDITPEDAAIYFRLTPQEKP